MHAFGCTRNSSLNSILFCNLLSVDYAQCRRSSTLASHVQVVNGTGRSHAHSTRSSDPVQKLKQGLT